MCLRRRFKNTGLVIIPPGARKLILDLEEKCCINMLSVHCLMDSTTGTNQSRWIIKIDEDEVLNETCEIIYKHYCALRVTEHASRPVQTLLYDDTNKQYRFIFLDLGRVERRFAVFFENKDTTNEASVRVGVVYDILED